VAPGARGAVHHPAVDVLVAFPVLWDVGVVAAAGVELAAVFDALCVLDVPPVTVG